MNKLSRRPAAAICDFDGTIADSMYIWTDAPRNLILHHGTVPPDNLLELISPMTMNETMAWIRDNFIPDADVDELTKELYRDITVMYARDVQPKTGAVDALIRMKAEGMRICILSATEEPLVLSAVKRFGIEDLFEFIACSDDWGGKTHADCFLAAAKRLNVKPNDAIVFEDALHAARTAKSAGFLIGGVYDKSQDENWQELKRISDWSGESLGCFNL